MKQRDSNIFVLRKAQSSVAASEGSEYWWFEWVSKLTEITWNTERSHKPNKATNNYTTRTPIVSLNLYAWSDSVLRQSTIVTCTRLVTCTPNLISYLVS